MTTANNAGFLPVQESKVETQRIHLSSMVAMDVSCYSMSRQ